MRSLRPTAVLAVLVLDRLTKLWAMGYLRRIGPIDVFPGLELAYVENTGAAFGMGRGANGFFIVVAVAMILVLLRQLKKWPQSDGWLHAGGTLVLAGAIGNLYDRLAYRYVVDFIYVHYFSVFNVADSAITVGACLLAWGLRDEPKKSS